MDGVDRVAVHVGAALVGLLTLALTITVGVGVATYEEPPPMLRPEHVAALAETGLIVVPVEQATRDHADDALVLEHRIERRNQQGAVLEGLSLARVTDLGGGHWTFDLVWVAYSEHVLHHCFGPDGACPDEPYYGRGYTLYDARTLAGIGGGEF